MPAKNVIEILIKASTSQAQSAIKALNKDLGGVAGGLGKFSSAFETLTGVSLSTVGAMGLVATGVSKTINFIKQATLETVAYAKSVRDLSAVLGTSAEETSRLIQVADDYLINVEQLSTALRFAVKNGFEPSVESLAQLSDELKGIQDPNERAAKLVEIFGRNWSALLPLLNAGGDAIRQNAAAIQDSLILTESAVNQAREYEVAVDNLQDTWQALSTTVGTSVIPSLTDLLESISNVIESAQEAGPVFAALGEVLKAFGEGASFAEIIAKIAALKFTSDELYKEFLSAAQGAKKFDHQIGLLPDTLGETNAEAEKTVDVLSMLQKTMEEAGYSTSEIINTSEQLAATLGITGEAADTTAMQLRLINDAFAANLISLPSYIQLLSQAYNGTLQLSDATVMSIEGQLEAAAAAKENATAMDGVANAATRAHDQLVGILDLAKELRRAGPRETRDIILDQLYQLMTDPNVDPATASAAAEAWRDIALSAGIISGVSLAEAEALPQFIQDIVLADPSLAAEGVDKLNQVFAQFEAGKLADLDIGAIGEDLGIVANQAEPIGTLADNTAGFADAVTRADLPFSSIAKDAQTLAQLGVTPAEPIIALNAPDTGVPALYNNASDAAPKMKDLAANIIAAREAAKSAIGPISNLAAAIAKLQSKTITITTIYKDIYETSMRGPTSRARPPVAPSSPLLQGRQAGGRVYPGQGYFVGEAGTELFIPSVPGEVVDAIETRRLITMLNSTLGEGGSIGAVPADKAARQALFKQMQGLKNVKPMEYPDQLYAPPPIILPRRGEVEGAASGRGVVVNNYFPIQRIEDEIETRQLARLVANEVTRRPVR